MDLTSLFVSIDDFYIALEAEINSILLTQGNDAPERTYRKPGISDSEIMTILVWFHCSNYRNFKAYYIDKLQRHHRADFPKLPSYNRFIELSRRVLMPLVLFLFSRFGTSTGISFIDSTSISVCRNQRIHNHKVFKGVAKRGKTSMGWFFGFKVHIIVSDSGELLSAALTPGNVSDKNISLVEILSKNVFGKLIGDKGYISAQLFEKLYTKGITLVTKVKNNMKNRLMPHLDRILLRKRAVIESVNDLLKNSAQIEHSRHRSVCSGISNIIAALICYTFMPKKPSVRFNDSLNLNQLEDVIL